MAFKTKTIYAFLECSLNLCIYVVYCFFHTGASVYNNVRDKVFGFGSPANGAKRARIVWKQRISFLNNSIPKDFLCLNFTSVEPEYILRPNVSLYSVTDEEAIFVETPAKVNIYSSDAFPFFFAAQFIHSTHVIKMSIESFHSLAEQVGNPSVPVTWMSNTGRCGSTMMSQVFESVEGTLVMAEPDAVQNVFYFFQDSGVSDKDIRRILSSTVRLLCKPHPGTERIFIKLRSSCTALMTEISTLFPDIRQLFLYRNCQDTVSSFANALTSLPYGVVLLSCSDNEMLSNFLPIFRKMVRFHIGTKRKDAIEVPMNENATGILTYLWAEQILVARDAISRDKHILTVRYEDIVSSPMETIRKIFASTEVDLKHLGKAVSSLDKDSQRGTGLSRSRICNQSRKVDVADRINADRILTSYNLPLMGKDFVF